MPDTDLKQAARWFKVDSPLGEDALLADGLEGREAISEPFRFEVSALAARPVGPSDLLGAAVTVSVSRFGRATRAVNGVVTALSLAEQHRDGYRRLRFTLEPAMAALRHASDYRVFQDLTVEDIAAAILSERGVPDHRFDIDGRKDERDYCVQFGETSLAFLSRLFAEEGWFYFFEHAAGRHTLVVADSAARYAPCAVPVLTDAPGEDGGGGVGLVRDLAFSRRLIDGRAASRQVDPAAPGAPVDGAATTAFAFAAPPGAERFRYGCGAADAAGQAALADAAVDAAERDLEVLSGVSASPELAPGHRFTLRTRGHDGVEMMAGGAGLDGQGFVVTAVDHAGRDPSYFNRHPSEELRPSYRAAFTAIPESRPFRPRRAEAKPLAPGPQTAIVVGPAGADVFADAEGRVRVQFPWDRRGARDEGSSCFVRVAQPWAGGGWGALFVPRVGTEVVVSFLGGDPDRPLVTGALYNGADAPPFGLPGGANRVGLRGRPCRGGAGEACGELVFDDAPGAELARLGAGRDFARAVGNDDALEVGRDQRRAVRGSRSTTVGGSDSYLLSEGDRSETIARGDATLSLGAGDLLQRCAGGAVTVEALRGITLRCGPSAVEIGPGGVTIRGPMVTAAADARAEVSGLVLELRADGVARLGGGLVEVG